MVKFFSHGPKAALNITQAFTVCQLSESHTEKLIIACKRADAVITTITIDTVTKFILWKEVDDLRENSLALVHSVAPFAGVTAKKPRNWPYGKFKSISLIFINILN
jgi:hypothetical protein